MDVCFGCRNGMNGVCSMRMAEEHNQRLRTTHRRDDDESLRGKRWNNEDVTVAIILFLRIPIVLMGSVRVNVDYTCSFSPQRFSTSLILSFSRNDPTRKKR